MLASKALLQKHSISIVVPTQVEKMRAELANHNHCAVPFSSRAAINLSWYDITINILTDK